MTIDFWTHDPGYIKTYTAMAKTLTEAKKTPFQYNLKVTTLGADAVVTKMLAQAQVKTGTPDVVGVEVSQFPRTMKNKITSSIFVNWTELLSEQEKSDLLRLADYAADGQTYAIESDTCPTVLYYRQDLFAKLGIDPQVATWEELQKAGAKTGKAFGICPNGTPGDAMGTFRQLYQQRGKNAHTVTPSAACPGCDTASVRVHSRYARPALGALIAKDKLFVTGTGNGALASQALPVAAGVRGTMVELFPELATVWAQREALHVDKRWHRTESGRLTPDRAGPPPRRRFRCDGQRRCASQRRGDGGLSARPRRHQPCIQTRGQERLWIPRPRQPAATMHGRQHPPQTPNQSSDFQDRSNSMTPLSPHLGMYGGVWRKRHPWTGAPVLGTWG
ncbi:hypothetical protein C1I99_08345 [Micromonospora deserti]|uniref:ABC transporter substrate-binding protein n=1 Tax=Micromonospora deserti TaxID=2070366 RepID=A0A2W2CTB5_9ACTN|nr:hypothetical protein C1I99_08345 [Micromonospora deserti]